jgi:protease I
MAHELDGKTIAFLVGNEGVEQVELTEPWQAVEAAGGTPTLLAPEAGKAFCNELVDKFAAA